MSTVVAVKVPEGLVLAADSASTLHVADGSQVGVATIFNTARKLIGLRDYPIGVARWGAGNMGARTPIGFVEQFENQLPPYSMVQNELSVRKTAEDLMKFLNEQFEKHGLKTLPVERQPQIGVIVGGYSAGRFFSDLLVFSIPKGEFLEPRPNSPTGEPHFGANWYGLVDAVVRLHHGRDDKIFGVFERLGVSKEVLEQATKIINTEIQCAVPFSAMPLSDALAYAEYLVNVVIGRFRFVVGPPLCDGPIDVAAINRKKGFIWVKKKGVEA